MAKKEKAEGKLPKGFKSVAVGGEFGAWHDFKKQPVLTGVVTATGEFKGQYGKQRTMTVKQKNGITSTFSESRALEGLFNTPKIIGKEIFVSYDGEKKLKGKKRVKLFTIGVK